MTADRRVICAECSETLDGDEAVAQPGGPGVTGSPEYRLMMYQFQYLCMLMLNLDPGLIKLNYELRLIFN